MRYRHVHRNSMSERSTATLAGQPTESVARPFPRHLSLQWTQRSITVGPNKGDTLKEAYIPVSRVQDFVAGELLLLQQEQ